MLNVLIAEDDLLIADMAEEVLVEHGYNVCGIARTVAEALALAWQHKPDLAILDVRLANGDLGTQIAAELAGLTQLGILYVTANVSAVTRAAVHGHACLAKPYRTGDLLRSLEIVTEMIDTGTASPPFPSNFHVLPPAGPLDSPQPDHDGARVLALRRQQSVIAGFGSFALRNDDLPAVLAEAARVCAEGLRAPFCKVYRYRSMQGDLLREAGYGWHAGVAAHAVLHADARSPEGRAFVTRQPVICNDLRNRVNSDRPAFNAARGTVATVDVIIKGRDGQPYGVLGASNNAQQDYDQGDVDFLTGVADILAESVASFERTEMLESTIEWLQGQAEAGSQRPDQAKILREAPQPGVGDGPQPANRRPDNPTTEAAAKIETAGDKMTGYSVPPTTFVANRPHGRAVTSGVGRPVLIVEDDVVLRDILVEHFAAEGGFAVVTAGTLAEADNVLAEKDRYFDAILLDVGLPDGDGCDYCAKLRHEKHGMPIIMLTGANDETDVVRGLDSGANDYLAKPFIWNELCARLRAQLRFFEGSEAAVFPIGPYLFRPGRKLLEDKARNRRILLTRMEAAVLKFLYRCGPGVVDRKVLAKEVWGYNSGVTTHTLETHMYRLRQKIEANPRMPDLLLTDQGGYRLNLAVVRP